VNPFVGCAVLQAGESDVPISRLPFVIGTVCVYGLAAYAPLASIAVDRLAMPTNIIVDPRLEPIVVRMLDRSPTFRDQSQYLGAVRLLRVRVFVHPSLTPFGQSTCRANAMLRKYQYGRIDALIRISAREDATELIAHELEHVREYIDGVRFGFLAARLSTKVWQTGSGHYETTRAIAVGRRVAEEVETKIASN
jgi:hypothetical protein